ncbi:hypothetical protein [Acuticoccus yangtzensis]|uniref:hypothetical protein n=1 Tax=Acuticoccus yangtzensis TaxID=1443441 RepID=UPI00094964ED|nr:hypothetical protein [Acuticoccus yangtzensis]
MSRTARHRSRAALRLIAAPASFALAVMVGSVAAEAQQGRFQIEPSGPNILRLDRETGAIASCQPGDEGWSCETLVPAEAPDAPAAGLAAENRRLKARVEVLERRLARIKRIANGGEDTAAAPGPPPAGNARIGTAGAEPLAPESGKSEEGASTGDAPRPAAVPTDEILRDIDQAVEVTGYALRQFRALVDSLASEPR